MKSQLTARRRSTPSHRPPLPGGRLRFRTNTADCNSSDSNTSATNYLDSSSSTTRRSSITLPKHSGKKDTEGNVPPRGWRYSREKQHIINYLKDPLSDIHLMSKEQIWRKYAANFDETKTKNNLSYLLRQHKNSDGPFSPSQSAPEKNARGASSNNNKDTESGVQPWTSKKKRSNGWYLLYKLRLFPDKSGVSSMTQKEIWESSKLFKCYPFADFKKYDNEMMKLTQLRRERLRREREAFECDRATFPPSERTVRDEPFWNRHVAKEKLKDDVERGLADVKPSKLRETRPEYKDFKPATFSKHVFQEKSKQRAAPYWQVKCKKIGQKLREEQVEELERNWIQSKKFETDLEDVINQLGKARAS